MLRQLHRFGLLIYLIVALGLNYSVLSSSNDLNDSNVMNKILIIGADSKLGQRISKKAVEMNIPIIGAFGASRKEKKLSELTLFARMENIPDLTVCFVFVTLFIMCIDA